MKTITLKLTQGALMVALAIALSMFAVFKLPNGGSITVVSMVPIILFSYFYDLKWGLLCSVAFALLQMMLGFYAPPTNDIASYILVVFLDYILAFGVLGFAGTISKKFKNRKFAFAFGTAVVIVFRFLCHFTSGIIIWKVYAPEGQAAWLYSLLYNGSYMSIELVLSTIVMFLIGSHLNIHKIITK